MEEIVVSAEVAPGVWLNAMVPYYTAETITTRAGIATLLTFLISMGAAILIARHIGRPVRQLSRAADQFGRGTMVGPVAESGPEDVRRAARAFNDMQDRLSRLINTQRTMLRAVGHDLRTPLTSLRIRAENLPPSENRDRMIATLEDMSVMTEEILRWAKDSSAAEEPAPVDLAAMLESLADDYAAEGADVTIAEGPERLIAPVRRVALKRVLTNLIDNAVKYGGSARLTLLPGERQIRIRIDDDGPGIPADQLNDVLRPFVRLEESRNKSTGGVGLGLSIAQSILEAQGGHLSLANRAEGGLRAELSLPS